jgi:16S rRNA (uracil1498-N3)-methyltransferase
MVEDAWHSEPRTPKITVIQALVSGDLINDSIAMMTELGVDCFIPWVAERSQARGQNVTNRWRKVASEATKQSGRAWLPELSEPKATVDLEPVLADLDLVLAGDNAATLNVGQVSFGNAKSLGLVVGPEGGLTPSEMDFFGRQGAVRVSLGPTTLRAVTAGVALVAALQAQMPIK